MNKVYITGHRNPDMDSVTSAYAYAYLKNQVDKEHEYVPVRLGTVKQNVKEVFSRLDLPLPEVLKDVKIRARDVVRTAQYVLSGEDPVYDLIKLYNSKKPTVVPIFEEGKFSSLVTVDDINAFFLQENRYKRPWFSVAEENIPRVIGGRFIKHAQNIVRDTQILVGAMDYDVFCDNVRSLEKPPLLVVGYRKRHIQYAIDNDFAGIILTGITDYEKMPIDFTKFKGFVYVSDEDTAETLRLLRLSMPIRRALPTMENTSVQADTLYDEVKALLVDGGRRGVSVFDGDEWIGFVTRRCFLDRPRKKVILMDHNEADQSVIGLEEAEVVEILDHHRLAAPKMRNPIFISSEPVGSTCTIVYQQFRRWDVPIPEDIARILLSGLVADTVMLKSPTTTEYDKHVARRLIALGNVESFSDFCETLFSSSSSLEGLDPKKVINSDFKKYEEYGTKVGIGQVEVGNLVEIRTLKGGYLESLEEERKKQGLDWAMLLVTDVFKENSILLCTEFDKSYRFMYEKEEDGVYLLPGVLSRKKQLLPEVIRVLED